MNRNFLSKGWAVLFMFAILFAGCSKDDEEVPEDFAEFSFESQAVMDKLPAGLKASSDEKAQECVEMIEDALDMSAFADNLEVPDNAVRSSKKASGETWQWTWTGMGEEWTFYWTYDEDSSKKYWTLQLQYGDGEKYDYITAWEKKDGSGGQIIYSFNWINMYDAQYVDYVALHWTYTWSLDSSGNYHFDWSYESDNAEVEYYMNYNILVNSDGSGSLDYFMNDVLFYHMEWDTAGNGSWIYYFGDLEQSGTWLAG